MNKKVIIGIVIGVIIIGVLFGAYHFLSNRAIPLKDKGNVGNGKQQLIEKLESVQDAEERKRQVDFALQCNIITQEEANRLY